MSHTVDIPQSIKDTLRKFRFARQNDTCALVIKIIKKELTMEVADTLNNISLEDLAEELPENSPRYVVLSYKLEHPGGRVSFPLCMINWSPSGSETGLMTLHASALSHFQVTADVSKVIEIRDGAEGLTKEFVDSKLLST